MSDIIKKRFFLAPLQQLLFLLDAKVKRELFDAASDITDCLNAGLLNRISERLNNRNHQYRFICQHELDSKVISPSPMSSASDIVVPQYYEEIIFHTRNIPTRPASWHDFFNGLVWASFPQSKSLLNELHIAEIEAHGLHPRTKVRNHLTHFDECGVVLFVHCADLAAELRELFSAQLWKTIFISHKDKWHNEIVPVIFGHANYEMLLQPFIGLTAKVLIVNVENKLDTQHFAWEENSERYDDLLKSRLIDDRVFHQSKPFYPLPLLGVPGWYEGSQNDEFYSNQHYFMPKRRKKCDA
ncbi:DUF3025 domain-containing protein [Glaciecola sp. MH2013]|uniref:DUF3025 domain-containing protein n=1 Tax=Glaciecola sp. MH2013 TaxID=2785524 RepID=UPI00189D4BCA|nr:DUF3025 domain-containing protein [Glaciecola sp. MH2013]MBF7072495.1 DUF3025 domain-containing protein [Glaciecola sp. MH2013]